MRKLLVSAGAGVLLLGASGCTIEADHHHARGGVYGGAYGEYPYVNRSSERHYEYHRHHYHPYDRDRYFYRDRW